MCGNSLFFMIFALNYSRLLFQINFFGILKQSQYLDLFIHMKTVNKL